MKSLTAISDINLNDDSSLSRDPLDYPYFEENSGFYWQLSEHAPQEINNPMENNGQKVQKKQTERPQKTQYQPMMEEKQIASSTEQLCKKKQTHRNNTRRKLAERKTIDKLISYAGQFSRRSTEKQVKITYAMVTKNLLTFAKKPHLDFIARLLGEEFINETPFLQALKKKKSINLKDYKEMYRCAVLQKVLEQFFRQKYLYRYLMTSRTTFEDRIYYSYFLDVFERNFRKGEFGGLSQTKVQIELEKLSTKK